MGAIGKFFELVGVSKFSMGRANEFMELVGIDVRTMNFYLNKWYDVKKET